MRHFSIKILIILVCRKTNLNNFLNNNNNNKKKIFNDSLFYFLIYFPVGTNLLRVFGLKQLKVWIKTTDLYHEHEVVNIFFCLTHFSVFMSVDISFKEFRKNQFISKPYNYTITQWLNILFLPYSLDFFVLKYCVFEDVS